jgi:simple sugar transport system permease protein
MAVAEPQAPPETADDRVRQVGLARRLLGRPELGAVAGAVLVWVFFALLAGDSGFLTLQGTASYLETAAELGILAVAVALLMIAGEFDLSIGSIVGAAGMAVTLLAVEFGVNIWVAMVVAVVLAVVTGLINGAVVMRTRLPSFIVTLGTLFIFRGATIGITRLLTNRTQVGGLRDVPGYPVAEYLFASRVGPFSVTIVWWLLFVALATWVLLRTRFGNWIFASGGGAEAARNVGVPVSRVKITLFVMTALAAAFVAMSQVMKVGSADTLRGFQLEFRAIIVAVIGGTLLTGGYGSAIGPLFGALIFGMVERGIVFAGVDADWFQVFLGVMLLLAVLVNNYIRRKAAESR